MKWIWDRHTRWAAQVDPYVDGVLSPAEAAAFEAHSSRCARCETAVADTQALKAAFAAAPSVEAPRSFRLTPEMAAGRERAGGGGRVPMTAGRAAGVGAAAMAVPIRVAGTTALAAAIALAAVVSLDLSRSGEQVGTFGASEMRTAEERGPSVDSAAPMAGGEPDETLAAGDKDNEADGAGVAAPAAQPVDYGPKQDGQSPAWLVAQIALAFVLAGSLGVMAVIWTRNRRTMA